MSEAGRREAGYMLGRLQRGEFLTFPESRPMPNIGRHCHELRLLDTVGSWRVIYRIDPTCILIATVFRKTTPHTPPHIVRSCQQRLRRFDAQG